MSNNFCDTGHWEHSWAQVSLMKICRDCGGLFGQFFSRGQSVDQSCRCRRTSDNRWTQYDYNEATTLCHACAAVPLRSGSRFSQWLCSTCVQIIRDVNAECRASVVPVGRLAIVKLSGETTAETGDVEGSRQDLSQVVESLKQTFASIGLLGEHLVEAVRSNCADVGLGDHHPAAGHYVRRVQADVLLRPRRIQQLLERRSVPASIIARVASQQSN
ncbi:hypothetical protein Poly51_51720 [Rubripirellula tenax]|uniref:Uncharacterized protein n=1 Tax=Rubripirellula tenax TaxID=2528015 RepID=A0A5C6EEC4_9BACT|nr:hypothetical protein [Rubripirellula tenax]TWU47372.1 hypothetical protein Poly51_51720 [Rubripirellula tenax]